MSNKTPYEIRLELLQMAQTYFTQQMNLNLEMSKKAFELAVEANVALVTEWQKYVPQGYTLKDVTEKAAELNNFVTKRD